MKNQASGLFLRALQGLPQALAQYGPSAQGWLYQGLPSAHHVSRIMSGSTASPSGAQTTGSSQYRGYASSSHQASSSAATMQALPQNLAARQIKVLTRPVDLQSRTGYAESAIAHGDSGLQDLKVPVQGLPGSEAKGKRAKKGSKQGSEEDAVQEPQPGTPTAAALQAAGYKLDSDALKVFEKFVGCMTKDGKKARAQGILREALGIIQGHLAAGTADAFVAKHGGGLGSSS